MAKQTLDLETFVGRYRALLERIAGLARAAAVAPSTFLDALLSQPFALPQVLRRAAGAEDVSRDLRELKREKAAVDANSAKVTAAVEAAIREVLGLDAESALGMRGGGSSRARSAKPQLEGREPGDRGVLGVPGPPPASRGIAPDDVSPTPTQPPPASVTRPVPPAAGV